MQCQRKQCLMDIQSETQQSRQITMQKQGSIKTISYPWAGDGRMWSFHSLPFPSSHSHSHSNEISLVIPIPMGIPWEFPYHAHFYNKLW